LLHTASFEARDTTLRLVGARALSDERERPASAETLNVRGEETAMVCMFSKLGETAVTKDGKAKGGSNVRDNKCEILFASRSEETQLANRIWYSFQFSQLFQCRNLSSASGQGQGQRSKVKGVQVFLELPQEFFHNRYVFLLLLLLLVLSCA
jgi:hypothetical protein